MNKGLKSSLLLVCSYKRTLLIINLFINRIVNVAAKTFFINIIICSFSITYFRSSTLF